MPTLIDLPTPNAGLPCPSARLSRPASPTLSLTPSLTPGPLLEPRASHVTRRVPPPRCAWTVHTSNATVTVAGAFLADLATGVVRARRARRPTQGMGEQGTGSSGSAAVLTCEGAAPPPASRACDRPTSTERGARFLAVSATRDRRGGSQARTHKTVRATNPPRLTPRNFVGVRTAGQVAGGPQDV